MHVSRVVYELKKNLGDYNSLGVTIEVTSNVDDNESGESMLQEARRIALTGTTNKQHPPQQNRPAVAPSQVPIKQQIANMTSNPGFVQVQDAYNGLVHVSSVPFPKECWNLAKLKDWKTYYGLLNAALPGYQDKNLVKMKGTDGAWYIGWCEKKPKAAAAPVQQAPVQQSLDSTFDDDDIPF